MISREPIVNAIKELDSNAEFEYNPEEDTINIIKSDLGITEKQIRDKAKLVEYKSKRVPLYPSLEDIIVALAEKEEGDDAAWKEITAQRAKVKADNPKPE